MIKHTSNFNYFIIYIKEHLIVIGKNNIDKVFIPDLLFVEIDPFNMNKLYFYKNKNLNEAKYKNGLTIINTYICITEKDKDETVEFTKMLYYKQNSFNENIFCLNNKIICDFSSKLYKYEHPTNFVDVTTCLDNTKNSIFILDKENVLSEFDYNTKTVLRKINLNQAIAVEGESLSSNNLSTLSSKNLKESNNSNSNYKFINFFITGKEILYVLNESKSVKKTDKTDVKDNKDIKDINYMFNLLDDNFLISKITNNDLVSINSKMINYLANEKINNKQYTYCYNNFSVHILKCQSNSNDSNKSNNFSSLLLFINYNTKNSQSTTFTVIKIQLLNELLELNLHISYDVKKCLILNVVYTNLTLDKYKILYYKSGTSSILFNKVQSMDFGKLKAFNSNTSLNDFSSFNSYFDDISPEIKDNKDNKDNNDNNDINTNKDIKDNTTNKELIDNKPNSNSPNKVLTTTSSSNITNFDLTNNNNLIFPEIKQFDLNILIEEVTIKSLEKKDFTNINIEIETIIENELKPHFEHIESEISSKINKSLSDLERTIYEEKLYQQKLNKIYDYLLSKSK